MEGCGKVGGNGKGKLTGDVEELCEFAAVHSLILVAFEGRNAHREDERGRCGRFRFEDCDARHSSVLLSEFRSGRRCRVKFDAAGGKQQIPLGRVGFCRTSESWSATG